MKVFFCYEEVQGKPTPVIYYGEILQRYIKEARPKIIAKHDVSHLSKGPDDEVSLAECMKLFPLLTTEKSDVTVKQETKKMVKAVTGFLSRNGERFFETEAKAKHYDAAFDLRTSATDAVVGLGINDKVHVTTLVEAFEKFLIDEADLVLEYLTTAREIQKESNLPNGMDGSSAGVDQVDDTRVRSETADEVGKSAPSERDSSIAREETPSGE